MNWHPTEDELILHYYGEAPNEIRSATEAHLAGCRSCAAEWRELSAVLGAVTAVPVPEPDESFEREVGASLLIRGLRAVSDFEYEFQMVAMNQRLITEIETVFLMADPRHQAISSKLVKEIAMLDGDISPFTTPAVALALINRSKEKT